MAEPATAAECRAAVGRHMPELLAPYDHVCALVGDDDIGHCILSHWRPPPAITGCSQGVWLGAEGPALVRNYDWKLDALSETFLSTSWLAREVIAKVQRPWGGCTDGMNADGLVASLTFGGSPAQGLGFSIVLMLRYVLETCRTVDEAVAALSRIPVAMSHNVILLDRTGAWATLFIGPGRAPEVSRARACTNHQETVVWPTHAAESRTVQRLQAVHEALDDPEMTLSGLVSRFLLPPLYSRRVVSPTAYTAVYRPAEGCVDYVWPGKVWSQRLGGFEGGTYTHDFGVLIA